MLECSEEREPLEACAPSTPADVAVTKNVYSQGPWARGAEDETNAPLGSEHYRKEDVGSGRLV